MVEAREWVNWSGSLRFSPGHSWAATDEAAVVEMVHRARTEGWTLRPVGAGHSSSPLVRTDGPLLDLRHLSGVLDHDLDARRATVGSGTRLGDLGDQLYDRGLAMENLGDVDLQAIAGAVSTGTHGTGVRFGNLSTQVAGMRLVTGTGEVVEVSSERSPELLPAVRLSLGVLGVATAVTLRLVPAFELRRQEWCSHIDWTLEHLDELQQQNTHMDFYWYPRSDQTQIRILNTPDRSPSPRPQGQLRSEEVKHSHRALASQRELRFDEMEYMLPREAFRDCFAEVRRRIKTRHRKEVGWRVLVRTIAADDIYLSPAHDRATTTIACLHNASLPHDAYFADMEAVFRAHAGRPHWGKKHSLTAGELRPLYPAWDTFSAIRRKLDPDGVFLSPDLAHLLEASS
jgi:FAD/FMN-containing dehydrogenase